MCLVPWGNVLRDMESCSGCRGVMFWLPWSYVLGAMESCVGVCGVFGSCFWCRRFMFLMSSGNVFDVSVFNSKD